MCADQLFFELIQVAIGTRTCLSHTPRADEWGELYAMAKKQSLVGVCFAAVQQLSINLKPYTINLDEMLYLTWMGMAAKIQQKNEVVNRQCVELQRMLYKEGFDSLILKGQGVGALYRVHENEKLRPDGSINPKPSTIRSARRDACQSKNLQNLRQPGDIDVWAMPKDVVSDGRMVMKAEERRKRICECCMRLDSQYDRTKEGELHASVKVFPDTDVEWHFTPSFMSSPRANKRLQEWFEEQWGINVIDDVDHSNSSNSSNLSNQHIKAPSVEFNLVYLLLHVYRHYLFEGVGLRQVMDYYVVLLKSSEAERQMAIKVLKDLGVGRFAGALMFVLHEVLQMDE